jgi:uncharacterized protein (DUF58 family)
MATANSAGDRMTAEERIRRIRQIEIRTRRLVSDSLAGQYHSAFKGAGMDFDEVREYQPGDEVRTIDWNVTARMNHPFVKKFREERELTLLLMVDLSRSGLFASGPASKREVAAWLASMLAFSAIRNQDRVGLVLFSDTVEHYLPPRKGRRHVLRVVRDILCREPQGRGTSVNDALEFARRILRGRSVVVVVSDFLSETRPSAAAMMAHLRRRVLSGLTLSRVSSALLRRVAREHDVIALQVSDDREVELPAVGRLLVEDAETGERVEVDTLGEKRRESFRMRAAKGQDELERLFRGSGVDALRIRTGADAEHGMDAALLGHARELAAFFDRRCKRRGR